MEPIPLRIKQLELATKFMQLGKTRVEDLSMTTSKEAPWRGALKM
jgi:hypothetical protein